MPRPEVAIRSTLSAVLICALLQLPILIVGSFATSGEIPPLACAECAELYYAWVAAEEAYWQADADTDDEMATYIRAATDARWRYEECVRNGCRPASAPDADGDGVPDDADACPGTPTGAVVDIRGCPEGMELVVSMPEDRRIFSPGFSHMTISGHVRELNGGRPIDGVAIEASLYDQGPEGVEWYLELDTTDSEGYFLGRFELTSIPPGIYSLRVTASAQGYADVSKIVDHLNIGDVSVGCSSDAHCDDGNPCTIDICVNPGTPSAYCIHEPIVACGNEDGCCPPDCDYTTDNDCPWPSNIEALNVLHDAAKSAILAAKEQIHALDDSPTPSQELDEELNRIDQGIEELDLGIVALDRHIEDQAQRIVIQELRAKNEKLEMELRLARIMLTVSREDNAELVSIIKTQEGMIKTRDAEMAAMQISISDDALLMMVGADAECEIEELHENGLLARVKTGVVGWFRYSKDALFSAADATWSVVETAMSPLDYINPFTVSVSSDNASLLSTHTKFEVSYAPASGITTVTVFEDSVTVTSLMTDDLDMVVSAGQRIEVTDDGFSPILDLSEQDLVSLADRFAVVFGGTNPLRVVATETTGAGQQSGNRPPTASFAIMPPVPTPEDTIVGVSTSSDPDGDPLMYSWYFDGEYDTNIGSLPEWTWPNPPAGEYTIGLVVMDGEGGVAEYSQTITVVGVVDEEEEVSSGSGSMKSLPYLLLIPVVATVAILVGRRRRRK